jgi:phage terminase large subunit-like protein
MGQKAICLLIIAALLLSIVPAVAPAGPQPASTSSSVSSGGGGGGSSHKQTTIDDLISAVKKAKDDKDKKYEQLRDMLYKEPTTQANYNRPVVYMYFDGNRTNITRTQPMKIMSYIKDTNPQDSMRRVLWLYLQEKKPGERSYEQISSNPQIIGQNDYEFHNDKGNYNYTAVIWPEVNDFSDLKKVGEVRFMVNVSDGRNRWTTKQEGIIDGKPFFSELVLNIINTPPTLENVSLITQNPEPRFNEPIKYSAHIVDNESDPVTVTLHIQDLNHTEKVNATESAKAGEDIVFLAGDYGFFSKEDSGKNFTYYYTVSDGINTTNTSYFNGPDLKKSITIYVDDPKVSSEQNQYWWQDYNFSIVMRNQESGSAKVRVSLETYTPAHQWKPVASNDWDISSQGTVVWYNVMPFRVEDANQPFKYRFVYDEVDQHGGNSKEGVGDGKINAKLVKYDIFSFPAVVNWLALLCIAMVGAVLVERRFYR